MVFSPLALLTMLALVVGLVGLFFILQIGLIGYAFDKVGVPPAALFGLLLLSWLGSWVNIPLFRMTHDGPVDDLVVVRFFGQRYVVPRRRRPRESVLAVNLGGALVPCCLSLYLLLQSIAPLRTLLATAVIVLITYWYATPLRGVGIAVPLFIPPLSAAVAAMLLVPQQAPLTAYVAGTVGTLIGADLLNLGRLRELEAPVMSIGGAGTFDGVFLTGILAVLLA